MPVAVTSSNRDGHDAERREIIRQLCRRDGRPGGIRLNVAKEERGRGKARAQDVATRKAAAATRLLLTLDGCAFLREHLRRDRGQIARQSQADAARLVQEIERIRRLVPGERQHALVHGPERHFAATSSTARISHPDLYSRAVTRPVLDGHRLHIDRQPLDLWCDPQLRVADAQRGTSGIGNSARRRAAAAHEHHRDERIGSVRLGDPKLERRRARADAHAPLLDQTLALHRDPRFRVRERRRNENRRGVADRVARLVGDQVHLELVFVVPRDPVFPRRPPVEARGRRTALLVRRLERHDVRTTRTRRERAGHRIVGAHELAARDGVGHPFADLLIDAVARALHAMPLAPHDGPADLHAAHMAPVGARRQHGDLLRLAGGPEVFVAEWAGGDVERSGVHDHAGGARDHLPVDVGDGGLQPHVRRLPLHRADREPQCQAAGWVQRVHTARCRARLIAARGAFPILPPPAGLAEVIAIEPWDVQSPGRGGCDVQSPIHDGARHRRAEQVACLDVALDGIAAEPRRGISRHGDEELRRAVFRHAVGGVGDVLPGPTLCLQRDGIRANRQVVAQLQCLCRGAER